MTRRWAVGFPFLCVFPDEDRSFSFVGFLFEIGGVRGGKRGMGVSSRLISTLVSCRSAVMLAFRLITFLSFLKLVFCWGSFGGGACKVLEDFP